MKVLALIGYDVLTVPGATRAVSLFNELEKMGHRVTLVSFPEPRRTLALRRPEEIMPRLLMLEKYRYSQLDFPIFLAKNYNRLKDRAAACDVIHLQKAFPFVSILALMLKARFGKPLAYDWDDWEGAGGTGDFSSPHVKLAKIAMDRVLAGWADHIIYANENIRTEIERKYGRREGMSLLTCGADPELFTDSSSAEEKADLKRQLELGEKVVMYHGQMDAGVFLDELLYVARGIDASFLLVGGGVMQARLESRMDDALRGKVRFTGSVPSREIPRYLSLADVAVATFEDTLYARCKSPLKIFEYLAMAKPIVGNAVGQLPDVLKDCSLLVPPGDREALRGAIEQVLSNGELARRLSENARAAFLTNHTWRIKAHELLGIYRHLNGTAAPEQKPERITELVRHGG